MKKHIIKRLCYVSLAVCLVCFALPAYAKVSVEEAERLKKDLTPFGAIRAGNAEGTIPAWEGGMVGIPEGITYDLESGEIRPDPFAHEKPLYIITPQNIDQYRDIINLGTQQLFERYPDFEMHVYPTHRTMAAPQWIYDNIYRHATTVVLSGRSMKNAYGGVGFPIPNWDSPEIGLQLLFNHMSMWKGSDKSELTDSYTVYEDGRRVVGPLYTTHWQFPFWYKEKDVSWYENSKLYYGANYGVYHKPPARKGEMFVTHRTMDYETGADAAWQYSPGTRRVRRAPGISHDTPMSADLATIDDVYNWNGDPVRFDWKYIESKEMLVPYNCYGFDLASPDDLLTPHFPNPKYVRWELHRVHVYEATLRDDRRHAYGRRLFYQDEDSWCNLLQDKYDTRGQLWRLQWQLTLIGYPVPFMYTRSPIYFDFQVTKYHIMYTVNGQKKPFEYKRYPLDWFTPQHLRRTGRR